jgi:hypothetical protein
VSTLRGDEESACAHKLDDPQLPRKAPVELTAFGRASEGDPSRAARRRGGSSRAPESSGEETIP